MNTKNVFRAALSMTAALVMTACSSDDNMTEVPAAPSAPKTIPYTVTVGSDDATTRATVGDDADRTLYFAAGDKLYITGTNIKGVLNITGGTGTTSATFSGSLSYSGDGTPADGLSLNATLVSAQQSVGTEVSVDAAGAVTVNYPTTAYCNDVATAVQKYSRLTGSSTYGSKSFTLTQQTAFLNFEITFEDGTGTTALSAVVSNGGSAFCTANVTPATVNQKTVAKFVLPVASGTVLSDATVKMGDKEALTISDATLTGKVYNVKRTYAAAPTYTMAAAVTASDKGKLICTDGHVHADGADADCTKTRVAKIFYVGSDNGEAAPYNHGLALALSDANGGSGCKWSTSTTRVHTYNASGNTFTSSESGLQYNDATHNTDAYPAFKAAIANNGTAAPTGCSAWFLASGYQWKKMIEAAGGYDKLGLAPGDYWSSTEKGDGYAFRLRINSWASGWGGDYKTDDHRVRACLAF
ncbi:MAG: hypothetical protein J6O23_11055 [Prevotella sp.]|nr:hypothetical protein [Prevotella sp.]